MNERYSGFFVNPNTSYVHWHLLIRFDSEVRKKPADITQYNLITTEVLIFASGKKDGRRESSRFTKLPQGEDVSLGEP